ncbi:Uncharacterised protein [Legionella beliardensis]|uniref:Uncharacterized protein n=1 Tax=Legionella beliardensis TaxID=91822 RepID=A0A378JQZ4_9GAMM|nr:hypothetical protein [Legionella beliardensis]STX55620.1 Uncharacterised protein [Legionella beliardensis]
MQTKKESELSNKLDGYLKRGKFEQGQRTFYADSNQYYIHQNTNNIMSNQQLILLAAKDLGTGLDETNKNLNELKKAQFPANKQNPDCLIPYNAKKNQISKMKITSLVAELQYHLDLSSSPGTNSELAPFKEGKSSKVKRKKSDALEVFNRFIALDNNEHALVAISMNQGVRDCLCQLAVHKKIAIENRKRCINLLLAYENRSSSETYSAHLAMYQLDKIEEMLISQQESAKEREKKLLERISELEKQQEIDRQKTEEMRENFSQVLSILKDMQQHQKLLVNEAIPSQSPTTLTRELSHSRNRLFISSKEANKPANSHDLADQDYYRLNHSGTPL